MDAGQKYTDIVLLDMEKELGTVYSQASKDVQKKLDNYLLKFEAKDIAKQELLAKGEITEAEYKQWRTGQVMISKRWEEMEEVLSRDMTNANVIASSIINDHTPEAYAIGMNYGTFTVEKGSLLNTSFSLYDRNTVERLMRDDPDLLPKASINIPKDRRWNKQHINSAVLQGVLQGEDIRTVSKRLQSVTDMNRNSAIRNARTMMTSAENGGRMDSYRRAERMGIKVEKQWLATPDGRTRHSHAAQDGEHVPLDEEFANGLMFPGDMDGDPREVYNCRCTMVAVIEDAEGSELPLDIDLEDMDYEDWLDEHEGGFDVVEGIDITGTWTRRESQFDFEIEDVINAQGFDGLPRVVSPEEFDKAVKRANGGNGFIAQRTYSAPDKEILDAYRDQLYHGKWYVDCSTGGAQYGRGMYCAADYNGVLSDGILSEMQHYRDLGTVRFSGRTISDMPAETQQRWIDEAIEKHFGKEALKDRNLRTLIESEVIPGSHEWTEVPKAIEGLGGYDKVPNFSSVLTDLRSRKTVHESYVETLTLDPSAKIISHEDLMVKYKEYRSQYSYDTMITKARSDVFNEMNLSLREKADYTKMLNLYQTSTTEKTLTQLEELQNKYPSVSISELNKTINSRYDKLTKNVIYDEGSYAASLGYDAINAEGHGDSGSYTVILNRTKVIFRGEN